MLGDKCMGKERAQEGSSPGQEEKQRKDTPLKKATFKQRLEAGERGESIGNPVIGQQQVQRPRDRTVSHFFEDK